MFDPVSLLSFLPKSVTLTIVAVLVGGLGFAGHEIRYMTVADFTKSYVLDIKNTIRSLRLDLRNAETDRERALIQADIDELIDELCYERPRDPMCAISA